MTNSPKLNLPERGARPKRLGTNLGNQPRLGNAGAGAAPEAAGTLKPQSPALSRWKRIREQVRIELIQTCSDPNVSCGLLILRVVLITSPLLSLMLLFNGLKRSSVAAVKSCSGKFAFRLVKQGISNFNCSFTVHTQEGIHSKPTLIAED